MDFDVELYSQIRADAEPKEIRIDGRPFTTGKVFPVLDPLPAKPVHVSTLSAVADYVNRDLDGLEEGTFFVRVASPNIVLVESSIAGTSHAERCVYLEASAMLPDHYFEKMLDTEHFSVWLQSSFVGPAVLASDTPLNSKAGVLKYISHAVKTASHVVTDDGTAQAVELKSSVSSVAVAKLPNPVRLAPYRTFAEVEQPESDFVFRCTDDGGSMKYVLFEADGGAWRLEAAKRVAEWLREHIENKDVSILR